MEKILESQGKIGEICQSEKVGTMRLMCEIYI